MSQDCGPQSSNAEATPGVRLGPHRQRPITERRSTLTAEAGDSSARTFRQTSQCRYVDGGPRNPAPPILQIPIARCFGSGPARSHKSVCTMYTINLSFHQARGAGDERIGTRSCTEEHVFSHIGVQGPVWSLLVRETLRFDRPTCADLLHTCQNSAAPCRNLRSLH